jgi:hypothetical protein
MSRSELQTMIRVANPVPDSSRLATSELEAFFSTIERRTSMVKQAERHPDVVPIGAEPPRRKRTALLVVAAAFAAVIAVVGIVAALSGPTTDTTVPPATTEAPTTTTPTTEATTTTVTSTSAAPPATITDAERAVIDGMIRAFNSGDIESFVSYLQPETEVFMSQASNGTDTVPYSPMGETVREHQAWRAMLDQRIVLDEPCAPTSPGVVACAGMIQGRVHGTVFPVSVSLRFEFEGDDLLVFEFRENELESLPNFQAFFDWVELNHPDDLATIMQPRPTPEMIALFDARLSDYEEFLWRRDLDPDVLAVLDGLEAAFNAEDFSSFRAYFTLETIYLSELMDTGSNPDKPLALGPPLGEIGGYPTLERSMRYRASMDQELTLLECVPTDRDTIRCEMSLGGPYFGLRGGVEGSLEISMTDGLLDMYAIDTYIGQETAVRRPFLDWLSDNYPEEAVWVEMNTPNDQAIATFENRLPEYLATLEG